MEDERDYWLEAIKLICKTALKTALILKNLVPCDKRPAAVFDVDDTVVEAGTDTPIKPVVKLCNKLLEEGFDIYFITARHTLYTTQTIRDLRSAGVIGWRAVFSRNALESNIIDYKQNCRLEIIARGNIIVLAIGDSQCDIGCEGGVGYTLPNKELSLQEFTMYYYTKILTEIVSQNNLNNEDVNNDDSSTTH